MIFDIIIIISKIYALILDSCPFRWDKVKAAWEGEVGEIIPEEKYHTANTHISLH